MATNAIQTTTINSGSVSRSYTNRPSTITEAYGDANSRSVKADGKSDRVELSAKGKLLSDAEGYRKKLDDLPDIRPEVIERAQEMIDSGELFSKDAFRKAAQNIRKLLGE